MPAKPAVTWNPYDHLRKHPRSKFYRVRFSHAGLRYEESTGESELDPAAAYALRFHAKVVSGQHRPPVRIVVNSDTKLDELCAEWTAEVGCKPDSPWFVYARHWCRSFGTFAALCAEGAIEKYWGQRLTVVRRKTVAKEIGPLEDLLAWCEEKELVSATVPVPPLPTAKRKKNQGVAFHKRRRGKATPISSEQARAIIDELAEWSPRRTNRYPVRAFFEVAYETGLRPHATLAKLTVPRHYTKGSSVLRITADIDKSNFERDLPLSAETRRWLDSVCPESGVIFGRHDHREALKKAVQAAKLPAHLAATMTTYDFKHRAATEMASTGDLVGAAFLMGWRQVTTANKYARPEAQAASRVIEARRARLAEGDAATAKARDAASPSTLASAPPAEAPEAGVPAGAPTGAAEGSSGVPGWGTSVFGALEGSPRDAENLNHSLYRAKERTRTSTGVTPLAPQSLVDEFPESFQVIRTPVYTPEHPQTPPGWGTTPGAVEDTPSSLGEISTQPAALGPVDSTVGGPNGVPDDFTNGVDRIATLGAGWGTGLQVPQQPVGLPEVSELDILSLSVRVLRARALGDEVSRDEALALARAALSGTEVGRLALEVLDGGPRATAATVQLAAILAADGVAHRDVKPGRAQ